MISIYQLHEKMFLLCYFYYSYKKLKQKQAAWYEISLCIWKASHGNKFPAQKEPPQSVPSLFCLAAKF